MELEMALNAALKKCSHERRGGIALNLLREGAHFGVTPGLLGLTSAIGACGRMRDGGGGVGDLSAWEESSSALRSSMEST